MQTAPPKKRSKIKLAGLILFALGGWGAAVITGMGLGAAKNQAVKDQQEAQVWKAKAGKAYTDLMLAKVGKGEHIAAPASALLQCVSEDQSPDVKRACGLFVLPPSDY